MPPAWGDLSACDDDDRDGWTSGGPAACHMDEYLESGACWGVPWRLIKASNNLPLHQERARSPAALQKVAAAGLALGVLLCATTATGCPL